MGLEAGGRVGAYEIVGLLGAGGMGEVYRARDTRLHREVAIKILPDLFALDPDRRARFEREAQVLASLNHPHIAAIYGFEESNSSGAIVMELVEGPTLADRIAKGPVAPDEALHLAQQLVGALDAAHEKGIIHRDLKPANVKLTSDGTVKVLDFGLAKALSSDAVRADITQSPTLSAVGTRAGVILGTAAYMSPEQARGQVTDKRADIWAFGCVVYELLTGRKAFDGTTVSDTVAAILTRDPDWSALPGATPSPVRRLLRRCLEKDPKKRLRDIGDAAVILEVPVVPTRKRNAWPVLAVALAAAAAGAIAAGWWRERPAPPTGVALSNHTIATRLTDYGGSETWPAISPDGRSFAFVSGHAGTPDIWLRQVTGGEPIRLTNDGAEESELVFAPDGEAIYFTRTDADGFGVWQVGVLGGQPRKILTGARSAAPSPDGRDLAYAQLDSGGFHLAVRGLNDQEPRVIARRINVGGFAGGSVRAAWSRNGRWLSFVRAGLFAPANVFVIDARTGEERQITRFTRGNEGVSGHVWLTDNRHVVVTYVPFPRQQAITDLGILDTETGSITRMTMTVNTAFATPSVSADGSRLIVSAVRSVRGVWKIPMNPGVPGSQLMDAQGDPIWTFVTRDGHALLVNTTLSGSRNLWLKPLGQQGPMRQITYVPGDAVAHSSLSPDGTRVAFASAAAGHSDIWVQNVDGTAPRQLTNDAAADSWPVWSPDGEWIVFQAIFAGEGGRQTWRVRSSGGSAEKLLDGGFRGDWIRQPSGSGTWIVTSLATSRNVVRLIDVERRSTVWEIQVPGSDLSLPMFSSDGRTFSMPYAVSRGSDAIGVFETETGKQLSAIPLPFHVLFRASWVDDGKAFLVNRTDQLTNVALFDKFWQRP